MQEEKARLDLGSNFFDNPFIGICVTDGEGNCLMVNDAQTRITQIPKDKFLHKNMRDIVHDGILSISSTLEVLEKQEEIMLHQMTSSSKSYDVKGVPIFGEDKKIKYVISYLLDISELMQVKEIVSKLQADKEIFENKIAELKNVISNANNIVYMSEKMRKVVEMTKKIAAVDAPVLIAGESGTGKELIANMLHEESARKSKAMIKINCAAIPEQLLESELFGYEAGAFTGGNPKGKKGIFEYADGGTILLDEIGEMPLALQSKLLRVLQDQEIRRIGSNIPIKVDVRLIASTNAQLKEMISQKNFREDLYYRLNVIEIKMPNLKEREEDMPILVEHFIKMFNVKYSAKKIIQPAAVQYLVKKDYPGNIRQLKNIVERLVIQSAGDEITPRDVIEIVDGEQIEIISNQNQQNIQVVEGRTLKEIMAEYEAKVIAEYVRVYGDVSTAANKLMVDRTTISRKLFKSKNKK